MIDKKTLLVKLNPNDNCAIMTDKGKMTNCFFHDERDQLAYADVIQGLMIAILKHPDSREGTWLWKIHENWSSIKGWEI